MRFAAQRMMLLSRRSGTELPRTSIFRSDVLSKRRLLCSSSATESTDASRALELFHQNASPAAKLTVDAFLTDRTKDYSLEDFLLDELHRSPSDGAADAFGVEWRACEFNAQESANTAWSFATVNQSERRAVREVGFKPVRRIGHKKDL